MILNTRNTVRAIFLGITILSVWGILGLNEANAATISRPMQSLGLVGYWSFDVGKGGAKAVDMSGRGNNGTLTNMNTTAAWVGGKIGNALSFDGVNDSVVIGDVELVTTQATFSLWAKFNVVSGTVLSKYGSVKAYRLFITGDEIRFGLNTDVNNDTTAANIVANTWYHIVGVFNGASSPKLQDIYINGAKQVMTGATIPNSIDDVTAQIKIGEQDNAAQQVNGLIDEVRVYNRALSAEEVKRLYRQTSPQFNASQANKLRQGLVGMWTFDGNDMGTTSAIDRSGSGNTGWLINGAKKSIGKIGQALNFDGSDDYVNAGSATVLDNISIVTYAAWIYPISYGENGRGNIINKTQLGNGPIFYVCQTTTNCGGSISNSFVYYQTFANGQTTWAAPSNSIPLNRWSHVAVTYTVNVANNPQLYLDGVPVVTTKTLSSTGANTDDSGNSLTIGNRANVDLTFNGLIDEVRVYNRALTPAEIRQLYKAGSSFHPNVTNKSTIRDGLVGHWSFDGADMGTTSARDASGNANTGWLINGTKKAIGKIGQALNFDGVDDYVDASTANVPLPATMSLFFYIDKNPTSDQALFSHNSGSNNGYRMGLNSTDATTFTLGGVVDYPFTNLVTSGAGWYFFAITVTGNSGTATGYFTKVGGALVTQSNAIGNPSGTPNRFTIGRRGDNVTFFPGLIDEVRVYNRALSPDEVKRLYNMGR